MDFYGELLHYELRFYGFYKELLGEMVTINYTDVGKGRRIWNLKVLSFIRPISRNFSDGPHGLVS